MTQVDLEEALYWRNLADHREALIERAAELFMDNMEAGELDWERRRAQWLKDAGVEK